MTARLHPGLDDMAQVLSRAALDGRLNLADEGEARALLRLAFPHADIEPGLAAALDRARRRDRLKRRLAEAAGAPPSPIGFGLLTVLVAALLPLRPTAARAWGLSAPSWATAERAAELVPILLGLALLAWCIQIVGSRARPVVEDERERPSADDVHRWNGEGR